MANQANLSQLCIQILAVLPKERDREVLSRRYGLDQADPETLEQIGRSLGVTRERVRQIERSALKRLAASNPAELKTANRQLKLALNREGGLSALSRLSGQMDLSPKDSRYVFFLAQAAPDTEAVNENRQLEAAVYLKELFNLAEIVKASLQLTEEFSKLGQPVKLTKVARLPAKFKGAALENLALITKQLTHFEQSWGLKSWPQINPKSIRDRAYLTMRRHGEPLHFSDIAGHLDTITPGRKVTTQAVHNELIKDERFVLIGRGIYALIDWGYTPGTVADMIKSVLREEEPLHKDEIVRRVLLRRHVKSATITLNLQSKEHFERVSKAVYRLKQV